MNVLTIFNLVLSISSFVLSVTSIITVILTLIQNNKMIENSTRPYITIYFDYTQMGSPTAYFVVKNFGNSSAIIDSLTFSDEIKNHPKALADLPAIFDGLVGNSIAPNQKFIAPFKLTEFDGQVAIFDISYHFNKKHYSEHIKIAIKNYGKLVKPRVKADSQYSAISYPIQEIAERLM